MKYLVEMMKQVAEVYGYQVTTEKASTVPEWIRHCERRGSNPKKLRGTATVFRNDSGFCIMFNASSYGIFTDGAQLVPDVFEQAVTNLFGIALITNGLYKYHSKPIKVKETVMPDVGYSFMVVNGVLVKVSSDRMHKLKGTLLTAKMLRENLELIKQLLVVR